MNKQSFIKKLLFIVVFLMSIFVISGCKKDPTLSFKQVNFEIEVGEIIELQPSVSGLTSPMIEYKFDKEGIVTKKEDNKFEAIGAGNVIIIATIKGYNNINVNINVIVNEVSIPPISEYTVVFDGIDKTVKVKEGEKVGKPTDPTKEGYEFKGWFSDKELTKEYSFDSKVSSNLTLYPKWEEIQPVIVEYTVTFDSINKTVKVKEGEKVQKPTDPTKEGFEFKGWFSDKELTKEYNFDSKVSSDLTLYPKWEEKQIIIEPEYNENIALATKAVSDLQKGSAYEYNGITFYVGYNAFSTISEALAASKETVYVAEGTYSENVSVSKDNIKLIGPNAGINPNSATRLEEAVLTGKVTFSSGIKNIIFKGFAFTGEGCVNVENSVNGIEISYNYIYDTNTNVAEWVVSRNQSEAVFDFWTDQNSEAKNIVVKYNLFKNVTETNILFARNVDVTVSDNAFYNFGQDAIRCEGGYNAGLWTFDNNIFKNDTLSGNNGIYFQSVSGVIDDKSQEIVITNNTFENIGTGDLTAPYTGAIQVRTYQEEGLKMDVLYNVFKNCTNYLAIRNNGEKDANKFSCNINYNAFYGVPEGTYHRNLQLGLASDTTSSNPVLTNMDYNYYETSDGTPIVDLSSYNDKFLHLASCKGNYATKAEYEAALKKLIGVEYEYVVNCEWKSLEKNTIVEAEGFSWTIGVNAFANISDCLKALQEGATIKVLAGTYSEEITITIDGITLLGANVGVNPKNENRQNESVIEGLVNIAGGVHNFTLNGFELKGGAQVLPGDQCSDIAVKYCVIDGTAADGIIRCPSTGTVYNIQFVGNYSDNNKSNRIIHVSDTIIGLTVTNNYFDNNNCYDFINAKCLGGNVTFKDNTFIYSLQSFILCSGVKDINVLIEGNKIENVANTIIDFRDMQESPASAIFSIQNNTFIKSGCGWAPIRIRTAGYGDGNAISINVNYNKFIDSYNESNNVAVFCKNPSFDTQSDPFKTIYNCDYNYYEVNGSVLTSLTNDNFGGAASSYANAYASEKDMPEYVVEDTINPTSVQITNKIDILDAYTTHQLTFKLSPDDVTNKKVIFISSDNNVATVSTAGLISAKSEGTCTITVQCVADKNVVDTMTFTIRPKERVELRYEGNGVLLVGETISISSTVYGENSELTFESSDKKVLTVDNLGNVKAIGEGTAIITAKYGSMTAEVGFTVIKEELSGVLAELVQGNNGVILNKTVTYIGSDDGSADYPHEVYGSANDYWTGKLPSITRNMLSKSAENYSNMTIEKLEYIVVHDTAGSPSTSTAQANSGWCTNSSNTGSSWHYTIGNDGIYQQLEENIVGYHAGDGTQWATQNTAVWHDTGIAYEGDRPNVTIGTDGYFYINGKKSFVTIPSGAKNVPLNKLGLVCIKGENGNYMLPDTWVCTQFGEYVCARGGNLYSIGIETAVNMGSDVYLTWQYTAKFVAQLLIKHNLTTDRVWFHNNFTNKNCPNTMITAGLVSDFLEMVYAEYEIAKNYADYEITFTSHNLDVMDNTGRIVEAPEFTTNVQYTITATKDGKSESITLNVLVPGKYN